MFKFMVILLALSLVGSVIGGIFAIFRVIFFIVLGILGLMLLYFIVQSIYHLFSPKAKQKFKEKINREKREKEEAENKEFERKERAKKEHEAWRVKQEEIAKEKENLRRKHRDADKQDSPYTYKVGQHGNESLAIRYGISNQKKKIKEYYYFAKGGVKTRNKDRDSVYYVPAENIRLRKTNKIKDNLYEVLLSDYRDRPARAVIEKGKEYIKTFYPLDDKWFNKHADLEETLKGNGSFTLKELATFHVQKTVGK